MCTPSACTPQGIAKTYPKLPASLFKDFRPHGAIAIIAARLHQFKKTRGIRQVDWENPAMRRQVGCEGACACACAYPCWQMGACVCYCIAAVCTAALSASFASETLLGKAGCCLGQGGWEGGCTKGLFILITVAA